MKTLAALSLALTLAINTAAAVSNPELHSAAAKSDAEAQFIFGFRYANGMGVPEDDTESVRWVRLAAEQGHASAQSDLGVMYATGQGLPGDDVEAYAWLSIATAQGVEPPRRLRGTYLPCSESSVAAVFDDRELFDQ